MLREIENSIEHLAEEIDMGNYDDGEVLKLSQAVLNLAHAYTIIKNTDPVTS